MLNLIQLNHIKTFYENKNENKDKEMEDMSLIQNESSDESLRNLNMILKLLNKY